MARIPDEEIEQIKREVSLERLAALDGVDLMRHGADLIGRCPFHDDKTPSLVITPAKNLWHCMGACQAGGSVIDWVKAREVSFRHAVEILRNGNGKTFGVRGEAWSESSLIRTTPNASRTTFMEPDADDREILSRVVSYYHETLTQSPEALADLEKRGLRSSEMIPRFKLGFANRTLGYRLGTRKARERLEALGIIRASGHEHFNGSLVIPILDEHGRVLGMYGRKITPDYKLRKGTPLHLYLPGPHRGVFNVEALKASKAVILCEALIDALTFSCAGYRNVTASYGVSGLTEDHLAAFKKHGTETVLIAYDRDDAGERAALSLSEKLVAQGITCFRIQFPKGMDANEYACKVTPAEKSLGVLLASASWIGKAKRPMAPPDPELEPAPPRPADDSGPPSDLELRTLFSWRDRVLTKPVPRRASVVATNETSTVDEASGPELETPATQDAPEASPARVSSSLSLAALAAKKTDGSDQTVDGRASIEESSTLPATNRRLPSGGSDEDAEVASAAVTGPASRFSRA